MQNNCMFIHQNPSLSVTFCHQSGSFMILEEKNDYHMRQWSHQSIFVLCQTSGSAQQIKKVILIGTSDHPKGLCWGNVAFSKTSHQRVDKVFLTTLATCSLTLSWSNFTEWVPSPVNGCFKWISWFNYNYFF